MTARRIYSHLRDLLDVLVSSPADGEVLTYSSAAGKWKNQAGGGGGSPAGSDGEVQFNDGGTAFGASPDLVWEGFTGTGTLKLVADSRGTAVIQGNAPGVQVQILASPGDATTEGGEIGIVAGTSGGLGGGAVTIAAGGDTSDGDGGEVVIASGSSLAGDAGDIDIRANPAAPAGNDGGNINVIAGQGTSRGGNVTVQGGGTTGNVQVYSGDGNQYLQLDNDGLQIGATKLGFFQGAAVAQPTGVAVSAAAIHAALVSLGLITA